MAETQCERCAELNHLTKTGEQQTHGPSLKPAGSGPGLKTCELHQRQDHNTPDSGNTPLATHQNGSAMTSNGYLEKDHGGANKDEEKGDDSQQPPQTVGLFHSSLSKLRIEILGLWARTVLILCAFILAVLSIYWGVLFHVQENLSSLNVFVVDFDGTQPPYQSVTPLIGPMITQTTEQMLRSPEPHLGFVTMSPAQFNNDPLAVRQAVFDFKAYAAIVINSNATALLRAAVETGNASYDPLGACQVTYLEARDQDTYYDYILPQLSTLETEITSKFGQMWTSMVLRNTSITISNLQAVPQALSPAIGFSQYSLRPFGPPVTTPAVTIGLIYLIIIAFFSFSFFLPIYTKLVTPSGHPTIPFWKFIIVRWCGANAAYFFMSAAYSLISLAFQIPFSNPPASPPSPITSTTVVDKYSYHNPNAYGRGTWPVYWMINFLGMSALGLACENVAMLIGQPWTALWLIFWVITNVATSFYSLDLSPRFYAWGYAWPLHNIVEASRSCLFDLHSRIGLNLGVLLCWVVVNSVLFPFCCYAMRAKKRREEGKNK